MVSKYIIDVRHVDRYEIVADTADGAIKVAKDCAIDNYGSLYLEGATFDAIRIDIPQAGDPSDAGMDGA
jgi:hypothetical protein